MSKTSAKRRQLATPRASLCVLGAVMQDIGVWQGFAQVHIRQKAVRYRLQQKLGCVLMGMLAEPAPSRRRASPWAPTRRCQKSLVWSVARSNRCSK